MISIDFLRYSPVVCTKWMDFTKHSKAGFSNCVFSTTLLFSLIPIYILKVSQRALFTRHQQPDL